MPTALSDGTINWLGGMDTSRNPADIAEVQYSKGCNVVISNSLGGIRHRFGLHCVHLHFENNDTKELYRENPVLAEGHIIHSGSRYLLAYVSGFILKFTQTAHETFYVENLNPNSRNNNIIARGWFTRIPNGSILNNGFDLPLYVTHNSITRMDPSKGEIGIGRMGVYVQNRLFYVDQSGKQIFASDFLEPTKFTLEGTNIFGFACPDSDEEIIAITKQKSIMGTVEGGNLIWSSDRDIYSVDVRGTRTEWATLGSRVGKVTETVPNYAAVSAYSFENFNTNVYFRSSRYGMADIKTSEYQFINLDTFSEQSSEVAYHYDNDTKWMLPACYTKACNKRLYTTTAPEKDENGNIYWNGIVVFSPSTLYSNQESVPRRHESVFTGVRPWTMTCVKINNARDELFIHSFDSDGITRLYLMDEDSDFDIDHFGNVREIEGFIETRAYAMKNPLALKVATHRFYRLGAINRDVSIKLFVRPDTYSQWSETWNADHLVPRVDLTGGHFNPVTSRPQTRPFVTLPDDDFGCNKVMGDKFITIQYRFEFVGPLNLDSFIIVGNIIPQEKVVTAAECEGEILSYEARKDYTYLISKPNL